MKLLCLADEGSNSSRFALIEKKPPQILRMLQIITSKIRNIRGIRGKNSPHCLADEGSNSFRFALIEKKEPQILRMSRIKTNKNP
jgi:exopolyphosphatase/pppGpp-phosphohydrolase